MSELMPFDFEGTAVRVVKIDGEPWFVAGDVCAVLGIGNVSDTVRRLDPDEFDSTEVVDALGRRQQMYVVNESGLYSLILGSRKPEAKPFKRWVTHEVLPQIRQTGGYAAEHALPQTFAEALRELASTVEAKELAERRAAELEPAAKSWAELADAGGDYSLRDTAQILKRSGVDTGQNRLSRHLREIGWTDKTGQPYQTAVDAGRLVRRATSGYENSSGEHVATWQLRVTPKGVAELHRRLGGSGPLLLIA